MISSIFNIVLYKPLLNALVFFTMVIPGADVGLAIIILTVVVRFAILPLSSKALDAQVKMKELEPRLKEIKEKHKDDRQEQAKLTMALYKEKGMNPFSGIIIAVIQIPILIALYLVFSHGLPVKPELLYSFIHLPETLNFHFLGLLDLTTKNYFIAILSGVLQFYQMQLAIPALPKKQPGSAPSMADDFARSMNMNMRYVMPVMIAFIGFTLPSAIVLYWATNNVFMIVHELVRRKKKELQTKTS